jgi:hypothetical protein
VVIVLAVIAAAFVSLSGREVAAPQWIKDRVATRLDQLVPGASVNVSDMRVAFEDRRPIVRLYDLAVFQTDGSPLVRLADAEVQLSARQLLAGTFQATRVRLNSAQLTLRRQLDGTFDFAIGEGQASVSQSDDFGSLMESLEDVLQRPQFTQLKQVEADGLTLRFEDVRANMAWTVDGGRLALSRATDAFEITGDFALLGARDYATTLTAFYNGSFSTQAAQLGMVLEDLSAKETAALIPAFAWLEVLDAPISGTFRGNLDTNGDLGDLSATLEIGAGALQPTEDVRPIAFSSGKTYLTFDPRAQSIDFSEISFVSDWISASATGKALLMDYAQGWPETLIAQLQLTSFSANPAGVYEAPITFEAGAVDVRLRLDPFTLDIGQATFLKNEERLSAQGQVRAGANGWGVSVDTSATVLERDRVLALWPDDIAPQTRKWFQDNLPRATVRDFTTSLRADEGERIAVASSFEFTDAAIRFMKTMPMIENASGYGVFREDRLSITLDQADIPAAGGGRVDIAGSSLRIDDTRVRGGPMHLNLRSNSTVTAAMHLLDRPPFEVFKKANRSPEIADGRLSLEADVSLPLRKGITPRDVTYAVRGTARDVVSLSVVPNRVLSASEIDVHVDNSGVSLEGAGRLGSVPIDGIWRKNFTPEERGRSSVSAQIELSERFIDEFQIALPPGTVSGEGTGRVILDLVAGEAPRFSLISDLNRIVMNVPSLAWSKAAADRGRLEVTGTLGRTPEITTLELTGPGLEATGRVTLSDTGGLEVAFFSGLNVGDWFDGKVVLTGQGQGTPPTIEVTSGTLDLRELPDFARANSAGSSGTLSVFLDRVRVTDTISLDQVRAELNTGGGLSGTFTGLFNGGPVVEGLLIPSANGTALSMWADQGAAVLQSMRLLTGARGGAADLQLTPALTEGVYNGQLRMRDLRLTDAPTLAELLSAISVVGLLEQLSGQGIVFNEVEASFQLSPDRVAITRASAIGPSMGISADGIFLPKETYMDIQGVLSPIYILNGIGSVLTRKGEGLIGFNFRLKGQTEDPRVFMNPFSVLTPGMFRELFRQPPPQLSQ